MQVQNLTPTLAPHRLENSTHAKISTVHFLQVGNAVSITSDELTTSITLLEQRLGLDRTEVTEVQLALHRTLRQETLQFRLNKAAQHEREEGLELPPTSSWVLRKEEGILRREPILQEERLLRQLERLELKRRVELLLKDRDLYPLVGNRGSLPKDDRTSSITTLELLPGSTLVVNNF